MRFKTLLGFIAIGGAVAYANKKRGGDWTVGSFKDTLQGFGTSVQQRLSSLLGEPAALKTAAAPDEDFEGAIDRSTFADEGGGFDRGRSTRY